MTLDVVVVATVGACVAGAFTGSPGAATGALYTGALSSAAALNTTQVLFGDSTAQSGASDRTLPPTGSTSEVLCFRIALPSTASSSLQGASATLTFTFTGKQSAGA
jgi:hypothetical protein